MNKVWLVLDVNNLCWRAHYTTGQLSYGDKTTGITYGFFKALQTLMDEHQTTDVVFCFDHGKSKRKELFPTYKAYRDSDPVKAEARKEVHKQIDTIKTKYLPTLGFKNIFYQDGYEADDIIAAFVKRQWKVPSSEFVVVSSDKDLYQILYPRVCLWDPVKKEATTAASFKEKYGIEPEQWVNVKAIAGCKSDGIKGVAGVGEKTAIQFCNGKHPVGSSRIGNKVESFAMVVQANQILVRLPLKGCKTPTPKKDKVDPEAWKKLAKKLGFASIADRVPGIRPGFGFKPRRINGG